MAITTAYGYRNPVFVSADEMFSNRFLQRCRTVVQCPERMGYYILHDEYEEAMERTRLERLNRMYAELQTVVTTAPVVTTNHVIDKRHKVFEHRDDHG